MFMQQEPKLCCCYFYLQSLLGCETVPEENSSAGKQGHCVFTHLTHFWCDVGRLFAQIDLWADALSQVLLTHCKHLSVAALTWKATLPRKKDNLSIIFYLFRKRINQNNTWRIPLLFTLCTPHSQYVSQQQHFATFGSCQVMMHALGRVQNKPEEAEDV